MRKILVFSLSVVLLLVIAGCSDVTTPQAETRLTIWADPQNVPYNAQTGWVYDLYISSEGNEDITLNKLELYVKKDGESSYTLSQTLTQSDFIQHFGGVLLSPGYYVAFTVSLPPDNSSGYRKYIIYGITGSGKNISSQTIVRYLPRP